MKSALAFLLFFASASRAAETAFLPTLAGIHDVQLKDLGHGEWEVRTTGTDPYFYLRADQAIDLKEQPILALEYSSADDIGRMLVFVGSPLTTSHLLTIQGFDPSEKWAPRAIELTATLEPAAGRVKSLRLTVGSRPGIVARLRGMIARPPNDAEKRKAAERIDHLAIDHRHADRLATYLAKEFPDQITSASAELLQIHISGHLQGVAEGLLLAEVPMWEDITDLRAPASLEPISADAAGNFQATINRSRPDKSDPLLSAWAVVRKTGDRFEPLSALHYVDSELARAQLPPAQPRSRKGLGGCPFTDPDMDLLGVSSVTINILLNHIISIEAGPHRKPFHYAGKTWYTNDAVVASYDKSIKAAADHHCMVSAIILIRNESGPQKSAWFKMAGHPDADSTGIYVLPNFTSREGLEAYAASMNFLAERYSRLDGKYGRIHDWIMHNEISSGYYWSNAGTKSLLTYLDLYQKSMRVAQILARQYDPNAKALISLDHCWTALPDPRCYPGKELLERMVEFSKKEGDFEWGIAYHPYAQDLRNPRTWEDTQATFGFQTPYITFKNIEVLDAWDRQPGMEFQGSKPREIQLTEQGLNSPDYSDKSLAEQAAGLAYAWHKIEPLKTITAFQYHLWMDNRTEDGLRLGLRKFADDPQDPGGKKPSWQVFQAIGTDRWEQASSFAKTMIGIKEWSEIVHKGEIR